MRHLLPIAAGVALALPVLLPCVGCSGDDGRVGVGEGPSPSDRTEAAATEAEAAAPAPASTNRGLGDTGGRSSLGAAKRSAKNTVGALEQRQSEIEKQIEEDNE